MTPYCVTPLLQMLCPVSREELWLRVVLTAQQELMVIRALMTRKIILPEQSRPLNHTSVLYIAERQLAIENRILPVTCHILNSGLLPKFKGSKLLMLINIIIILLIEVFFACIYPERS